MGHSFFVVRSYYEAHGRSTVRSGRTERNVRHFRLQRSRFLRSSQASKANLRIARMNPSRLFGQTGINDGACTEFGDAARARPDDEVRFR